MKMEMKLMSTSDFISTTLTVAGGTIFVAATAVPSTSLGMIWFTVAIFVMFAGEVIRFFQRNKHG